MYARQQHANKGFTCEACEQRHTENESTPPCERGKYDEAIRDPKWPDFIDHTRCPERRVVLLPANILAWELYWISRTPAGVVLMELQPREMTAYDAADTAWRIQEITHVVSECELADIKAAENKGKGK